MTAMQTNLFSEINSTISELKFISISVERKQVLQPLVDFIQSKILSNSEIRIVFICTHNSRRSHLSQIWAQTLAYYFGIDNLFCYSGGTEATAVYPMLITSLKKSGFQIKSLSKNDNPIYRIKYADNEHPIIGFSKEFDDDFNPKSAFVAVMTCDVANEACPFVPGAEKRISIIYEDPKIFDATAQEAAKYDEKSREIATELFYVFSQLQLYNGV